VTVSYKRVMITLSRQLYLLSSSCTSTLPGRRSCRQVTTAHKCQQDFFQHQQYNTIFVY